MNHKTAGLILIVFSLFSSAKAVNSLFINNTTRFNVTNPQGKIVLSCDAASEGNTLILEIMVDQNNNEKIDVFDKLLYFAYLVDGLGPIVDQEMPKNIIPGDETERDRFIRTTLTLGDVLPAYSPQTWIVRVTDEDHSTVQALIEWSLSNINAGLSGCVLDVVNHKPIPHVRVQCVDPLTNTERCAVSDQNGHYALDLYPGEWLISLSHPVNQYYKPSVPKRVKITKNSEYLKLFAQQYDAFISGQARFSNGDPVENITIVLQHQKSHLYYHTQTDDRGNFRIGVEPGLYKMVSSQYYAKYLGNHYWPEGFYGQPVNDVLTVSKNQTSHGIIQFLPYPSVIRGTCHQNGTPLDDVLIQGIAIDPLTGRQKLFQTFSNRDGAYTLGVCRCKILSLIAQKSGGYSSSDQLYENIDMTETSSTLGYDFNFSKSTIMSLSGKVVDSDNRPLADVSVVAYNQYEPLPEGHLITRTDQRGEYHFEVNLAGDWQIGVFKNDYLAHPQIYYKYLSPGITYHNLDFILSTDKKHTLGSLGKLKLADFNILPHYPDPLYNETVIDFVLPKAGFTQIEVFDIHGQKIVTLLQDKLSCGYQKICWNGKDTQGDRMDKGLYFCRIKAQNHMAILPITLLK